MFTISLHYIRFTHFASFATLAFLLFDPFFSVVGIDRISKIRILTNIWHPASNHPFPQYWILRQYWTQNWTDPLPSHDAFYEGDFWWLDCKMSRVSHDSQAVLLVQPSEGFVSKCLINPYSFVSCLSFTIDFPIQACPAGGFRYSLFKESRPQWLWKQKLMSWKHGSTIWRWLSWLSWLPLLVQQSWVGVVVFPTFRGRFFGRHPQASCPEGT